MNGPVLNMWNILLQKYENICFNIYEIFEGQICEKADFWVSTGAVRLTVGSLGE